MRGLRHMRTPEQMREYIALWTRLQAVELSQEEDSIVWKLTSDGNYTARSAYLFQFMGSLKEMNWTTIWKAKTENKCKFHTWLMVQSKIFTADKLIKRGMTVNKTCGLCNIHDETCAHMTLKCSFSKLVWEKMEQWSGLPLLKPNEHRNGRLKKWWKRVTARIPGEDSSRKTTTAVYTTWNIWKERNRRGFDNKASTVQQVCDRIKEDLELLQQAAGDEIGEN